jgi:hypothetical protein
VEWDALRFATWRRFLRSHLVARGENRQWDFSHLSLRQAVFSRIPGEWVPQPGHDPRPALHSTIVDYLEAMPSGAPVHDGEMMWQMLGTRNLLRFAQYYALPESGSGKLAEYLIEENRGVEHPIFELTRTSALEENVPEKQRRAIGNKFNFELHQALHEHDGGSVQASLLEVAETLFIQLHQRHPQSAKFARDLWATYNKLGDLHRDLGHGEQAMAFYVKALVIAEELRHRNPQSADSAFDLSLSYNRLGGLHAEFLQLNPHSVDFTRGVYCRGRIPVRSYPGSQ